MSITVRISERMALTMDPVRETEHTKRGVLLTLEGRAVGDTLNCAIIPLDRVLEVVQTLQMVAHEAART